MGESDLVCVVEIPKGGRNKYEYDPALDGIKFDRLLVSAATYPTDYGYLRDTLAQDGDPLDALVCLYEPTFPGCRIRVRPIGVFHMVDEKGADEKVICVPINDPSWGRLSDIHDVPGDLRNEIEHFFQVYKDLDHEGKVRTYGFGNRADAEDVIGEARARVAIGDAGQAGASS